MAYGSILSAELDSAPSRKERGAFFTPPQVADFLADFAVKRKEDRVLEPAAGEAVFISAVASRLSGLGASGTDIRAQVEGYELHGASAAAARERLGNQGIDVGIHIGDFFEMPPRAQFDAVVGNPPYIRYQSFTGRQRAIAREDALRAGVRLGALASSWAAFTVHATQFLREGGRLAFVLPAELLSVNYAAPVRRYLLSSFSSVCLVLFEDPIFPEVQEEVILLLADGFGLGSSDALLLQQVRSLDELGKNRSNLLPVSGDERWPIGPDGHLAQRYLHELDASAFSSLSEWGRVRLGAVTGANSFFALSQEGARDHGLPPQDLLPLCPPGSRHLRGLSIGEEDLRLLAAAGRRTCLFYPLEPLDAPSRAYVSYGEERGVANAYKCRVRKPWWRVPGLRVADLFLTYMNGYAPSLCSNDIGIYHLNSVHGVFLDSDKRSVGMRLLPMLMHSTPALLSAEQYGRSYGGGLLKLEPREALRIAVPSSSFVDSHCGRLAPLRREVSAALRAGDRGTATAVVDEALLGLGAVGPRAMAQMAKLLRSLRDRRYRRGRGVHALPAHDARSALDGAGG